MEQRSAEWFEARKGVITGSRVGGILGVNPYAKPEDVLREMVREYFGAAKEFNGNAATNHGEKMEPVALAYYEKRTGNHVDQVGFVKHDKYDWIGASPDGLIGVDGGLEIKCPYWAKAPYSVHEKPSYYAQCQLVMEVCDLDWMDFVCYISDEVNLLERIHREESWFAEALPKLEHFRVQYLEAIADPANRHLESGLPVLNTESADRMTELFLQIKSAEKEIAPLKEEFDTLKQVLGKEFGSFQTGRMKVTKVEKKGSVDNKVLFKELDVDGLLKAKGKTIDDYRKEGVISYNVTAIEE